ncbi:MAG: class II glutamine amidotransferase [Candidatus Jordarchaeum sp.]|uniref:class II glutamine amidotransferase n=1 Tax=Candidatus Jordarchaeum sp. TaxID=2823881 RepID=UPI00404A8C19
MCKLLAVSGNQEEDLGNILEVFVKNFGAKNPDGWGIAFLDESTGLYHIEKVYNKDQKLLEETFFQDLKEIKTKTLIAHLRKASIGRKSIENCHPFENYVDDHQFVFIHNGTVWPRRIIESKLVNYKPKSSDPTDSELVFCYIMDVLEQKEVNLNSYQDMVEAINKIILRIRSEALITKLNFILADHKYVYCYGWNELQYLLISENANSDSHNKKQFSHPNGKVVVCSKPILENYPWNIIPPKTILVLRDGKIQYTSD